MSTGAPTPEGDSRHPEPDTSPKNSANGGRGARLLPFIVVAVVTLLVSWFAFAMITGVPVGFGSLPTSAGGGTNSKSVVLTINNPYDTQNNSSGDQYAPANFSVPAHTLLEITLINYDDGMNPVTPTEGAVSGTVGDCIYLNTTVSDLGSCVKSLDPQVVSHTFSFVSGPYAGFNVPLPSAAGTPPGGTGASVTFFAYFNTTGTFTWNCLAPCDAWSMATPGFMTGTMTVH